MEGDVTSQTPEPRSRHDSSGTGVSGKVSSPLVGVGNRCKVASSVRPFQLGRFRASPSSATFAWYFYGDDTPHAVSGQMT
jgi:hypothetical protein